MEFDARKFIVETMLKNLYFCIYKNNRRGSRDIKCYVNNIAESIPMKDNIENTLTKYGVLYKSRYSDNALIFKLKK